MRNFPARPTLARETQRRLQEKTDALLHISDTLKKSTVGLALNLSTFGVAILFISAAYERSMVARKSYEAARTTQWFKPVVNALRSLCGDGELCMYCSSNEPSQVEHYRPLAVFSERAFQYENYLWTCDICNRTYKGERFPPDTEPGDQILNPLEDNVWDYFFLSEQNGRLMRKFDIATNDFVPRATSTCKVVGIDRENVQKKRQHRFRRLRLDAEDLLHRFEAGTLSQTDLRTEIEVLRAEPFQADVADYFLNGPGRQQEPFRSIFAAMDATSE